MGRAFGGSFVRLVLGDDATDHAHRCHAVYFAVDGSYDFEAFLGLPADQFKFLRAERTTAWEFDWHASQTRKNGHSFRKPEVHRRARECRATIRQVRARAAAMRA